MAPWHHRHARMPNSANGASFGSNRNAGSGATSRSLRDPLGMAGLDVLDNSNLQVDSSSSDSDLHPSGSRRQGHGRSLSHPFPSLFSHRKKRQTHDDDSDSEATDGRNQGPEMRGRSREGRGQRQMPTISSDFVTGHCMTCGSLVRWPRELKTFKCTICLMINDLPPNAQDPRRDRSAKHVRVPKDATASAPPRPANPISLEHTRTLVVDSLRSFIRAVVAGTSDAGAFSEGMAVDPSKKEKEHDPATVLAQPELIGARGRQSIYPTRNQDPSISEKTVPTLRTGLIPRGLSTTRSLSTSFPERRPSLPNFKAERPRKRLPSRATEPATEPKRIFRRLEDYIVQSFSSLQNVNESFPTRLPNATQRPRPEASMPRHIDSQDEAVPVDHSLSELDAKLLLAGDFAENGLWWTGGQGDHGHARKYSHQTESTSLAISMKSPEIDWHQVDEWYTSVINAGEGWEAIYDEVTKAEFPATPAKLGRADLESQILTAQEHLQRVLLKATETLLKRPGRTLPHPSDTRFLLILLANPLLHASSSTFRGNYQVSGKSASAAGGRHAAGENSGPASGKHSGIIKRILGIISNLPNECHRQLTGWLARYPESRFIQMKDLVGAFLAYRLMRQNEKKHESKVDFTADLIPNMTDGRSAATLHAALGSSRPPKKSKEPQRKVVTNDDWQIRAAACVMALIFSANNSGQWRRHAHHSDVSRLDDSSSSRVRERVRDRGQILPTSDFYNTLLDNSDLIADFEAWEERRGKFSFCQYPFLLSIWAKIQILEHDARRQMANMARDAFFNSIMSRRTFDQYLVLHVRRDCLVEDSLKSVSEVIGSGGEDIKKGLRIKFKGEEGIDAGGLRKEWFLLLVREVFNPDHGMFVYDDDSRYCYFNPNSFETSDQYFLVGVVFGLAIYNSTILDVALPPFAFRKLLMAAPVPVAASSSQPRQVMKYTLDDLAEYRPCLAYGLQHLLDYDGDVEETFCLDFVVTTEKYGAIERVPLCAGGERMPVTKANRREYVELYVRYLLETAVARQFEPFKRGFYTVCGGNALSLFRPEEIELLVRGSDEALDITSLRAVADYEGWGAKREEEEEPTVQWFWQSFEETTPVQQRKLLSFITGSDRIPAMGAASLSIRISCLGEDTGRYPTARTCFNMLSLYRYNSRAKLEKMLWTAVRESEGFGLK